MPTPNALKTELIQYGCFIDDRNVRIELLDKIETCHNTLRGHALLEYLTLVE